MPATAHCGEDKEKDDEADPDQPADRESAFALVSLACFLSNQPRLVFGKNKLADDGVGASHNACRHVTIAELRQDLALDDDGGKRIGYDAF